MKRKVKSSTYFRTGAELIGRMQSICRIISIWIDGVLVLHIDPLATEWKMSTITFEFTPGWYTNQMKIARWNTEKENARNFKWIFKHFILSNISHAISSVSTKIYYIQKRPKTNYALTIQTHHMVTVAITIIYNRCYFVQCAFSSRQWATTIAKIRAFMPASAVILFFVTQQVPLLFFFSFVVSLLWLPAFRTLSLKRHIEQLE